MREMSTKNDKKSGILESVHETAADLHRLRFIDKRKMQKYDALCLEQIPERGSTNVYADLGFGDADEMLVKAQLATKIGEIIQKQKLTQMQAAELLGIPQPTLSNMLRGQFRGISETRMIECLARLG